MEFNKQKNRDSKSKTMLCNSLINGLSVCRYSNCKYAHSIEEVELLECDFGFNCRNFNCLYFHSGIESFDLWLKRLNYEHLRNVKIDVVERVSVNPNKTKLCKNVIKKQKQCLYPNCNYAHNINELKEIKCVYDGKCKSRATCLFKHSNETRKEYLIKRGMYKYRNISVKPVVFRSNDYTINNRNDLEMYRLKIESNM